MILGVILRVIFGLKNDKKISLKIEQKRDPGRRGPRKLEDGHFEVAYDGLAAHSYILQPVLPETIDYRTWIIEHTWPIEHGL